MKLFTLRIGDTLHIYDTISAPEIAKQVKKGLDSGKTIYHPNGKKEWIDFNVHFNPNKNSASESYTWDKSGNKIKHDKIHVTLFEGKRTEKLLGTVFKKF